MIIGATFFIGSLLRWGFQLMEKILKPEEDVELIKEVDKEVEAKERALLVWDSHMKALIDSDLQKRLPYEVLHGAGPAPSYSTQAGHPLRCYTSSANWPWGSRGSNTGPGGARDDLPKIRMFSFGHCPN